MADLDWCKPALRASTGKEARTPLDWARFGSGDIGCTCLAEGKDLPTFLAAGREGKGPGDSTVLGKGLRMRSRG